MSTQKKKIPFIELYHMAASDIEFLENCHIQTARRKLREIKKELGKSNAQLVSLEEYAKVTGYCIDMLRDYKKDQIS